MEGLAVSNFWMVFGSGLALGFLVAVFCYLAIVFPFQRAHWLKDLNERKNQFIGLASHYLLTPITIIQSALGRLQEKDASLTADGRFKLYDTISLGQQRLLIVAEQLILVNEVDHGDLRLKVEVQNLADLVASSIAVVDVFARHKEMRVSIKDDLTVKEARVDARRMRQAVVAALDNAIKFGIEGTEVQVRLYQNAGIFFIDIEDRGIGI
jgi:signal transduction histidine kinase